MEPCCIVEELLTGGNLLSFLHSPAEYVESQCAMHPTCAHPFVLWCVHHNHNRLDWTLRLKILKDVAKGCAFLHGTTPPVMHRDLKTPNILVRPFLSKPIDDLARAIAHKLQARSC
jgi:serine/threonine protein kinase